jgi:hypothetical protein
MILFTIRPQPALPVAELSPRVVKCGRTERVDRRIDHDRGRPVEADTQIEVYSIHIGVHKSVPIGSREHDNIVDPNLGDREWRAVHKMVVVRSHWPCRLSACHFPWQLKARSGEDWSILWADYNPRHPKCSDVQLQLQGFAEVRLRVKPQEANQLLVKSLQGYSCN